MPKTITSPVRRWPGTVILSDPLSIPQTIAFEDALNKSQADAKERGDIVRIKNSKGKESEVANAASGRYRLIILDGILPCVEGWQLDGLPETLTKDTFPGTPRIPSVELIAWLVEEISKLFIEANDVPNA